MDVGTWESVLLRSAVWRMPQPFIVLSIQKVTTNPAKTTAHPLLPSGIAVVLNSPGPLDIVDLGFGEPDNVRIYSTETKCRFESLCSSTVDVTREFENVGNCTLQLLSGLG